MTREEAKRKVVAAIRKILKAAKELAEVEAAYDPESASKGREKRAGTKSTK